jgi:hypothetical protein
MLKKIIEFISSLFAGLKISNNKINNGNRNINISPKVKNRGDGDINMTNIIFDQNPIDNFQNLYNNLIGATSSYKEHESIEQLNRMINAFNIAENKYLEIRNSVNHDLINEFTEEARIPFYEWIISYYKQINLPTDSYEKKLEQIKKEFDNKS